MDNDSILKELLALSKESAVNDAEIKAEVKHLRTRMDKQDTILETLTENLTKQKEINSEVAKIKEKSNANERRLAELDGRVTALENIPNKKTLDAVKRTKGIINKAAWVAASAAIGAAVGFLFK
jgi:predicted  nucleic acid-binding Zn-ribbon protein